MTPANEAPVTPSSTRTSAMYWVAAFAVAAVLLYYSVRGVEWKRVLELITVARWSLVAVTCALGSVTLFLRSFRWRVLLLSEGQVAIPAAFWATAAGYFGNNFLPARAGEIVRTLFISAKTGLNTTFVLTTALTERVADAIVLVSITVAVLLSLGDSAPGWLAKAARPMAVVAACSIATITLLPRFERTWRSLIRKTPLPENVRRKLDSVSEQILLGLRTFHNARRLAGFSALTILIWVLDACGTVLCGRAIGLSISFPVAFLLMAGLGLGSALPSTPGYVGIYQFVAVTLLTPFGILRTDAIAYILLAQALQYVVITAWGLAGIAQYKRIGTIRSVRPVCLGN